VLAQVPEFDPFGQVLRHERMGGVGKKSLPAVPDRSDASSPVDIHTDIAGLPGKRLACVESDADLQRDPIGPRMCLHGPLRRDGGRQCIPGPRKRREHGIPLGVHHVALGVLDGGAEQAVVSCEDVRVAHTNCCRRRVDPSMSVKRKVTVPVGRVGKGGLLGASGAASNQRRGSAVTTFPPRPAKSN
jgi:hypothetical protein